MIGDEEVALWHQAVASADALDVYLDWLLIHDPIRGELLRKRMQNVELSQAECGEEYRAWVKPLGLDGFQVCKSISFTPLPSRLTLDAQRLAPLEAVLDQLPFLHICLDFASHALAKALGSPVVRKIRALSYDACGTVANNENYQSYDTVYYGDQVVAALCASPNLKQLEVLWLGDHPGRDSARLVAGYPFEALRDLSFFEAPIGDEGVLAITSSPIIKTLRRLSLYHSEIGDAGALALARDSQLEQLTISGHTIGATAAAALRAMPSMNQLDLVPEVFNPFESLAAFRSSCGEPTMPLEQCLLCSITPEYCDRSWVSSLVSDYDVDYGEEGAEHKWNRVPAQIAQLEPFLETCRDDSSPDECVENEILRCPTCRRLYLRVGDSLFDGPRMYSTTSYRRLEAEPLFRTPSCVMRRLPGRMAELAYDLFRRHEIVRIERVLFSLDEHNRLIELTSEELRSLIASDPPEGLDEPARARVYARFVDEIQAPESRVIGSFAELRWRDSPSEAELRQVEALRAIRIDDPVTEQVGDDICVRSWVISSRRLICRVVTVRKSGDTLREDAVIAEQLPVA